MYKSKHLHLPKIEITIKFNTLTFCSINLFELVV